MLACHYRATSIGIKGDIRIVVFRFGLCHHMRFLFWSSGLSLVLYNSLVSARRLTNFSLRTDVFYKMVELIILTDSASNSTLVVSSTVTSPIKVNP